jgi:apolipoprotein N-acyltransferase
VGIFGLSALLVTVNGVLAEALVAPCDRRHAAYRRVACVAAAVGIVVVCGAARLRQVDAWPVSPGLRVGVVHTQVD